MNDKDATGSEIGKKKTRERERKKGKSKKDKQMSCCVGGRARSKKERRTGKANARYDEK
jgi:hypothetical protein